MYRFSLVICWAMMAATAMSGVSAFVVPTSPVASAAARSSSSTLSMVDPTIASSVAESVGVAISSGSGMLLAETEAWVKPTATVLGPFLNFMSFAMLCRVVASWYPDTNLNEFPWAVVAWPSEPLLRLAKGKIPPAFGVDITPVFWLAIFTFINEILLGQQGLLVMKMKYGI
ncbi:unnamed protein product [Pseudo-nitzschia multistriata]|uniref:YggT family protein n=1 Tax=Pseudo-nitzschia multistriata TaxID=183589 RepID=A0A448ZCP6_9STRA|nr:unnamed protein product [Pseudo-nitzschia multistriata]